MCFHSKTHAANYLVSRLMIVVGQLEVKEYEQVFGGELIRGID